MKSLIAAAIVACAGMAFAAQPAAAAGCLTGAAVGAGAGHIAGHHAVLGGVAGCAVGHHHAKTVARKNTAREQGAYDQGRATGAAGQQPVPVAPGTHE